MSLPINPSQNGGYPKFKFIKCNSTRNRHAVSSRAGVAGCVKLRAYIHSLLQESIFEALYATYCSFIVYTGRDNFCKVSCPGKDNMVLIFLSHLFA